MSSAGRSASPCSVRCSPASTRPASRRRPRQLPEQAREAVEGSIGAVIGLVEQGLVPAEPLLDVARESFVDGLHLAAIVGACVTVVAALIVKRYLPADRDDAQVTGHVEPARRTPRPYAGRRCRCARSASTSRAGRTRNGDTVRKCDLDLAPDAPWRCPDNCPKYERRLAAVAWTHGSLTAPPTPDEPASVADGTAAALLDEAENHLLSVGDQVRAEVEAERARNRRGWRRWFAGGCLSFPYARR